MALWEALHITPFLVTSDCVSILNVRSSVGHSHIFSFKHVNRQQFPFLNKWIPFSCYHPLTFGNCYDVRITTSPSCVLVKCFIQSKNCWFFFAGRIFLFHAILFWKIRKHQYSIFAHWTDEWPHRFGTHIDSCTCTYMKIVAIQRTLIPQVWVGALSIIMRSQQVLGEEADGLQCPRQWAVSKIS